MVKGLNIMAPQDFDHLYSSCVNGKSYSFLFPKISQSKYSKIELVVIDLTGPMSVPIWDSFLYALVIIEVSCCYPVRKLLHNKDKTGTAVHDILVVLERQSGQKVCHLHSNNGSEFINQRILGAFRTSPTGEIEALAGLIPIHLHLKKLVKQSCLRAATLPSQHALLSLLSACNSKGAHPHPQSLALLTDTQSAWLRSPLLDTKASLLNLTKCFDLLHSEIRPGDRLLNNFPDHVSFHPCDRSNRCTRKLQFDALDQLCHEASSDPSILVVATDASVIPPRNMQAVSVAHF